MEHDLVDFSFVNMNLDPRGSIDQLHRGFEIKTPGGRRNIDPSPRLRMFVGVIHGGTISRRPIGQSWIKCDGFKRRRYEIFTSGNHDSFAIDDFVS